jgi:hypothetical protein
MSLVRQAKPALETLFPVKFIIGTRQILSVPKQLHKISFYTSASAGGRWLGRLPDFFSADR